MKLSKVQKEVVQLMKEGWELGSFTGSRCRIWLQKNGLGRGGKTKSISHATLRVLKEKRVIEGNRDAKRFYLTRYKLIGGSNGEYK